MDYEGSNGRNVDKTPIDTEELQLNYTEPGSADSPLFEGGFVLGYNDTQAEALENHYLTNTDYLRINWKFCTLEFLHLTPNTKDEYFALSYVRFTRSAAGIIKNTLTTYAVRE